MTVQVAAADTDEVVVSAGGGGGGMTSLAAGGVRRRRRRWIVRRARCRLLRLGARASRRVLPTEQRRPGRCMAVLPLDDPADHIHQRLVIGRERERAAADHGYRNSRKRQSSWRNLRSGRAARLAVEVGAERMHAC